MKEIWKDIKGYEGMYQISNLGRVKSLDRNEKGHFNNTKYYLRKEKILNLHLTIQGYYNIGCCYNSKRKYFRVHRLVAQTFIPNPKNKPEVNHINGIKTDNNVTNLEWVTSSENQLHAYKTGLEKKYFGKDHKGSKPVLQFDLDGNFIREWDCISQIAKTIHVSRFDISSVCRGLKVVAKGYIWKFK